MYMNIIHNYNYYNITTIIIILYTTLSSIRNLTNASKTSMYSTLVNGSSGYSSAVHPHVLLTDAGPTTGGRPEATSAAAGVGALNVDASVSSITAMSTCATLIHV